MQQQCQTKHPLVNGLVSDLCKVLSDYKLRPLQNSQLLPHFTEVVHARHNSNESLILPSLNHNFQNSSLVIYTSKLPSLSLSVSCVLKFIKVYDLLRIPRLFCNGLKLLHFLCDKITVERIFLLFSSPK